MLKAGTETGSLMNHAMSRSASPAPEIGMGATILMWTDRHAATITWVSASGKSVRVQRDRAIRADQNGMSESQAYSYERDEQGKSMTFRMTKRGWRSPRGCGLAIGHRAEYYDYSF